MLTPDEPADAVPPHAQLDRELAPEPQRVEPRAHPEHTVPPETLRHDGDAELHGVGHHDDHLVPRPVARDGVGVLREHGAVRGGEDPAVGVGSRPGRGREARGDDDHVGRDVLGGVRDVEERRVLVVRVDEVRAQAVHGPARRPARAPHELEPRRRREHPPLDDLRAHLPADVSRRPHHRYVHPGRLRRRPVRPGARCAGERGLAGAQANAISAAAATISSRTADTTGRGSCRVAR